MLRSILPFSLQSRIGSSSSRIYNPTSAHRLSPSPSNSVFADYRRCQPRLNRIPAALFSTLSPSSLPPSSSPTETKEEKATTTKPQAGGVTDNNLYYALFKSSNRPSPDDNDNEENESDNDDSLINQNTNTIKVSSKPKIIPSHNILLQTQQQPHLAATKPASHLLSQQSELSKVEEEIYVLAGHRFNLGSSKQLSIALFGEIDKAETGLSSSTNKDILDAMASAGNPIAAKALIWRKIRAAITKEKDQIRRASDRGKRAELLDQEDFDKKHTRTVTGFNSKSFGMDDDLEDQPGMSLRDPLTLVDASAYIFRAYYAMPPMHRPKDGMPTGAVMGFCSMINKLVLERLIKGEQPRLVLVFDARGKNFRHEIFDDYKANRAPCPVDLIPQFDLVRAAAKAFGIPQLEAIGFEADDVIATLATDACAAMVNVNVISSDKDLMQLVTKLEVTPSVHLIDPMKQLRVSHDVVEEKWGVPADLLGDLLALAGDTADNIPGIRGIGPKIAAELINEYGNLENLLENAHNVKQKRRRELLMEGGEMARLSRRLVELERRVPPDVVTGMNGATVGELRMEPLDEERLISFFKEMGFGTMRRQTQEKFSKRKVVVAKGMKEEEEEEEEIVIRGDFDVPF